VRRLLDPLGKRERDVVQRVMPGVLTTGSMTATLGNSAGVGAGRLHLMFTPLRRAQGMLDVRRKAGLRHLTAGRLVRALE